VNRKHTFLATALLSILAVVTAFTPTTHGQQTVAARVAAWVAPAPTLAQIVEASQRVFVSEGGFVSTADENVIYRVFRQRAGRHRDKLRRQMQVIVAYSNRTFPEGSPFVPPGLGARTKRQKWVSEINLACDAPRSWTADVAWDDPRGTHLSYEKLCHLQRKRAWRLWQGKTPNWCQHRVDHWGGYMDMENPTKGSWVRVTCDDPALLSQCEEARQSGAKSHTWPVGCSRNIAWCDPGLGSCPQQTTVART
jgi:hypothetical protein